MAAVGGAQESRRTSENYDPENVQQGGPAKDTQKTGGAAKNERPVSTQHPNTISDDAGFCPDGTAKTSNATTDARATTHPSSSGYAEDPMAKLKKDPDYIKTSEQLRQLEAFEDGFYGIDRQFGGGFGYGLGDYILNWGNIEQAAKEGKGSVQAAARMLKDNPELFALIDKDKNGEITGDELKAAIAALKQKKAAMEAKAKSDAAPPPGNTPPPGEDTKTGDTKEPNPAEEKVKAELDKETPRPELSKLGGLEGAAENMNNMLGWAEAEYDRLAALYAQTSDPAVQKQIENKMQKLTRQMQSISNMYNQILTMLSNLQKMQSDIAMNTIRNMR